VTDGKKMEGSCLTGQSLQRAVVSVEEEKEEEEECVLTKNISKTTLQTILYKTQITLKGLQTDALKYLLDFVIGLL
jgi:hypothetical protein